jgi:hypothetical protein
MAGTYPSREQVRSIVGDHLSQQYTRSSAVADARTELDRLHSQLVDAARAYESGPETQRQAVCETLEPLSRVVVAIVDLCNQNRPDPLFSEKPKSGKGKRSLMEAVRQGQCAALAKAWLDCHASDEVPGAPSLASAARRMSGKHFGTLTEKMLNSSLTYQRQSGHHDLIYKSYAQMGDALKTEAIAAGGGLRGLRAAIDVQIDALNAAAELRQA